MTIRELVNWFGSLQVWQGVLLLMVAAFVSGFVRAFVDDLLEVWTIHRWNQRKEEQ